MAAAVGAEEEVLVVVVEAAEVEAKEEAVVSVAGEELAAEV